MIRHTVCFAVGAWAKTRQLDQNFEKRMPTMGINIKNTLKQLARAVVYAPCWEPLWDCIRDFGAVMMIHSISYVEPNGIEDNQSLRTSPECLDRFLTAAKKKGFTFVCMDEIIETLAAKKAGKVSGIHRRRWLSR